MAGATNLQTALDPLPQWAKAWQLRSSIYKRCDLNIGESRFSYNFYVDRVSLPVVHSCVDIDFTVDSNLVLTDHIRAIVLKAHQRANLINRCFVSRDNSFISSCFLAWF